MKIETKFEIGDKLFYLIDYMPNGCIVNFGKVDRILFREGKIFYLFHSTGESEEKNCFSSITDAAIERIKHLCNQENVW